MDDHEGEELYIVVITTGAYQFGNDLMHYMTQMMQYNPSVRVYFKPFFHKLSSYVGTKPQANGNVVMAELDLT
eukprot:CAMPEP_0116883364 /NCGR_PEP_ID=MMETSP0463-20121206/15866_1 /TAXON_ID=181622 /ORGANISM="Strombidinopsis sp, Strain SopsisLIS2011" /LENGTH=72 /DNA_ID=CAMNT_0004538015 /DNA_START=172 /DNA_END=390 /DNA_ORIENTATION=-